jgi:hypothetical protein
MKTLTILMWFVQFTDAPQKQCNAYHRLVAESPKIIEVLKPSLIKPTDADLDLLRAMFSGCYSVSLGSREVEVTVVKPKLKKK